MSQGPPPPVPYVVGQWVRGERFYGRKRVLAELAGAGWRWVAGLRRIGKTSLLRQLEHLAALEDGPYLPIFWDLQGCDSAGELALGLEDALLEAEEALAAQGLAPPAVGTSGPAAALEALAGELLRRGRRLLLLCDEAEELLGLERRQPGLVAELWRRLQGREGAVVVIASSVRLESQVAQDEAAGRLTAPFGVPLHLGVLGAAEARSLLLQDRLAESLRPRLDPAAAEDLLEACGRHPMLLQLAGKRCLELGDPQQALAQLAADRAVEHLLAVDLELLREEETRFLEGVAQGGGPLPAVFPPPGAERLLALGLVECGQGELRIPNRFLASRLRGAGPAR